jgi:hypothetical protein
MNAGLTRVLLACWEWRYRRRMRAEIDDWLRDRFLRRVHTAACDRRAVEAFQANLRAQMRASLRRTR